MAFPPQLCIGIDLGTTNSSIAVFNKPDEHRSPVSTIENTMGQLSTPSVVAFTDDEKEDFYLVGQPALNLREFDEALPSVFYQTKKLIGRNFNEKYISDLKKSLTYELAKDNSANRIQLKVTRGLLKDQLIEPIQVSALILHYLKNLSAKKTSIDKVTNNVVITVPANFNDKQRKATADAAKLAGLNPVDIISEPIAACIKYAFDNSSQIKSTEKVIVFDFGGGTLDVSLVKIEASGSKLTVLATAGDNHFGGSDIDVHLFNKINQNLKEQDIDLQYSQREEPCIRNARMKILSLCEEAKKFLSAPQQHKFQLNTELRLPYNDVFQLQTDISKPDVENFIQLNYNKIINPIDYVLDKAKMKTEDISQVLLVGGSSLIPIITNILKDKFKNPNIVSDEMNKQTAICEGAAIYGAFKVNKDLKCNGISSFSIVDVTPLDIGINIVTNDKVQYESLIKRNSPIPCSSEWKRYLVNYNTTDKLYKLTIQVVEAENDNGDGCQTNQEFNIEIKPDQEPPPEKMNIQMRIQVNNNGINLIVKKGSEDQQYDNYDGDYNCTIPKLQSDYTSEQWTQMLNRHKQLNSKIEDDCNIEAELTKALNSIKFNRGKIFPGDRKSQNAIASLIAQKIKEIKTAKNPLSPNDALLILQFVENEIKKIKNKYIRPNLVEEFFTNWQKK